MPDHRHHFVLSSLILTLTCLLPGEPAEGQNYIEVDPFDSSVRALKAAIEPTRDGSNHKILLALRQLRDSDLTPLFEDLLDSSQPLLRIDALLALNELETGQVVELRSILARFNQRERLIAISALIDLDLLDLGQARALLDIEELEVEELILMAPSSARETAQDWRVGSGHCSKWRTPRHA